MKPSRQTENWKDQGSWMDYKGRKIFILRVGSGEPCERRLLCLHAFPTSSYDYARIVPHLSSSFELILFDYLGYGFSDKPQKYPYSLREFADITECVANHFGLKKINLLAHDIGDSVALELLSRPQLDISKLMLLNGSVWSIPFTDWSMLVPQRLTLNPLIGHLFSSLRLFNKPALKSFFKKIFFTALSPDEIDAFWSVISYNDGPRNYHLLMKYMPERWKYQEDWLNALRSHPAKIGALWGMNDPVATPEVLDVITSCRPDIISTRLQDTGHYPHWERPAESAAAIKDFFSG